MRRFRGRDELDYINGLRGGQQLVLDLVEAAADDTWDAYREVRSELPGAVAEEFERRLAEVSTHLRRICTGAFRSIGPGT